MKAFPAPAKRQSPQNCSGAATKPFMGTGNWCIEAIRKRVYRCLRKRVTPTAIWMSEHQIWDVEKVKAYIANRDEAVTFFCGGSRNFSKFIDLLDGVFVLDVDLDTMNRRIDERVALDPTDFGGKPEEREEAARLHQTKEGIPKNGIIIDATAPLARVVDEILRLSDANKPLYPNKAKRVGAALLAQSKSTARKPRAR